MKDTMENIINEEDCFVEIDLDDGTVAKLYQVATVEYRGNMYGCFQRAEPESEEEEDEIIIFGLREEGDETVLFEVEDDQLLDEVFAEFCHQYEDFENSEEAEMLDD